MDAPAHINVAQTEFRTSRIITTFRRAFDRAPKLPVHSQPLRRRFVPTWPQQGLDLVSWFFSWLHLRRVDKVMCERARVRRVDPCPLELIFGPLSAWGATWLMQFAGGEGKWCEGLCGAIV